MDCCSSRPRGVVAEGAVAIRPAEMRVTQDLENLRHTAVPIDAAEASFFRGDIESMKLQLEETGAKYKALDERLVRYEEIQKGILSGMQSLQGKFEKSSTQSVPAAAIAELQSIRSKLEEVSNQEETGLAALLESKLSPLEERVKCLETDHQQVVLQQPLEPQAEPQASGRSMQLEAIDARLEKMEQAVRLSDDGGLPLWVRQHLAAGGEKAGVAAEAKQQVDNELLVASSDNAQADTAANNIAADVSPEPLADESAGPPIEHAIQESVWEAAVLLGLPDIGFGSSIFLFITMLLNLLVQGYMCFVLITSPEFNGEDKLSDEVVVMNNWRNVDGHIDSYTNMFDVNLVSRVCHVDSSLSLASSQMNLLVDINSYLALDDLDLELSQFLPVGPLLCMLCLSVFVTMMVHEFREVAVFVACLVVLPHNMTQIKDNTLAAISHSRLVCMCALSFFRFSISAFLLYNGTMWLSSTKSIGDLILNAAALGFVMDIDELFFATLVPLRVPCYVQRLEPMSCSQPRFEIDTVLCLAIVASVLLITYITKVGPFVGDMLDVKTALCGGSLEFILASGKLDFAVTRLPGAGMGINAAGGDDKATRSANELRSNPRLANGSYYFVEKTQFSDVLPEYSLWCKTDKTCVEIMARGDIAQIANFLNPACSDLDSSSAPGLQVVFRAAYEYWKAGGAYKGNPMRQCGTCAPPEPLLPFDCPSYRHLCGESVSNILVRVICPVTCGCNNVVSGLYLAGSAAGCPASCEAMAAQALASQTCEDAEVTGTSALKPAWETYWNDFRFQETVLGNIFPGSGMPDQMISGGCPALSSLPNTLFWKPCEMMDSMKNVGRTPVLAFCPRTCCDISSSNCLPSCTPARRLLQ